MAEWNGSTSWRQGHLLDGAAIDALGLRGRMAPDKDLAIVATHDCDLAQPPDIEPDVEIFLGKRTTEDGNYTHVKNSRRLHVEFIGNQLFFGEFLAQDKIAVKKVELIQFEPLFGHTLNIDNKRTFQMWLARRYRRSAFANEFNDRLARSGLAEKIARIIKPSGQKIMAVLFDVDGGEEISREEPSDTYRLDITILYSTTPDTEAAEAVAKEAANSIRSVFEQRLLVPTQQWQQIELASCEVISESVISYQDFKRLQRWQLDHLSLRANPQQPVIVE